MFNSPNNQKNYLDYFLNGGTAGLQYGGLHPPLSEATQNS